MKFLNYLLKSRVSTSEIFSNRIQKKIGVKISNKNIYKEAFTHSSTNLKDEKGKIVNFERLEFLGDALLTSIIAEYLYLLYPESKEGFLTKMRAKIVSRSNLNRIGKEMGLFELVKISNLAPFCCRFDGNIPQGSHIHQSEQPHSKMMLPRFQHGAYLPRSQKFSSTYQSRLF